MPAKGWGGRFLEQDWDDIADTIDTNVKGTVSLIHRVGGQMAKRDAGRILVTGSIVADMPGTFNLVYNSTKAFVVDFCVGLATELEGSKCRCHLLAARVRPTLNSSSTRRWKTLRWAKADKGRSREGRQGRLCGLAQG